jgi:integrase
MFLTAKLREKDLGIFVEPASIYLSDYLDKWLEEIAKPRLRQNTFDSYSWIVKKYIKDKLGRTKLSDLQSYQIQKLYGELLKKGLSPKTVRYTHTILSSALKQAVKWKMFIQNPCDLCELPRLVKKEMKYFTPEEAKLFLDVAKTSKWFVLFLIIIESGMRPEEYFGLQWKDIDFEQGCISVRRVVIEGKQGGFYFAETKTKKSRRKIPISTSVINALKLHRHKQLEARMKLGADYQNLDLIFASEVGTPLQRKNFSDRHFKPLMKKAKVSKIRLYDLRHTTATLLLSESVNPKIVQERLGHSSIVLTLDTYSHVLPTMQEDATAKLEKLMLGK